MGGVEGLAEALCTNLTTGIKGTEKDLADRKRIYGINAFPKPKIRTLYEIVMANFEDDTNRILLAAACVSMVIGIIQEGFPEGMVEGTSICIALAIIIVVGSSNEYVASQRTASMIAMSDKQMVTVYRGSSDPKKVDSEELVVGDIIEIENGYKVPADCVMLSGQEVKCKEDELTGEPDEFEKVPVDASNYKEGYSAVLFAKTTVVSGIGKAMVTCVGTSTASGNAADLNEEDSETHLQKKLNMLTLAIGKVGYYVAIMTFFAQVIRILVEMFGLLPCGCTNLFSCQQL